MLLLVLSVTSAVEVISQSLPTLDAIEMPQAARDEMAADLKQAQSAIGRIRRTLTGDGPSPTHPGE